MRVNGRTLDELLDFVERAPDFTACSNSDVAGAGVSILGHHHYQMFDRFQLPVTRAGAVDNMRAETNNAVLELLNYPLTTLRLRGERSSVFGEASRVLQNWKSLNPQQNTCNVIACRAGQDFELYLCFRNPRCQTPEDLRRIKSEGVGVVEAGGEGIYPPPPDDDVLQEIRTDGLRIIKRILDGLNAVEHEHWPVFFEQVCLHGA